MNEFRNWVSSVFTIAVFMLTGLGVHAQGDQQSFIQSYLADFYQGLSNPRLQTKMWLIWNDLHQYSGQTYRVLPAEQFTAGQALPGGVILLDVSIAGNPNDNVTRFFLAHEWGHQVHGDPYTGMTTIGRYKMAITGTQTEDNADQYATTFMKARGYDIDGAVKFFCALPDAGPADTHSSGIVRAANISRWYWGDSAPKDPCNPTTSDIDMKDTLAKIIAEASTNFSSLKGDSIRSGEWLANIKFQDASACYVNEPAWRVACAFRDTEPSELISRVRKALDPAQWDFVEDSSEFRASIDNISDVSMTISKRSEGGSFLTISSGH
jgi:hypothetical protein